MLADFINVNLGVCDILSVEPYFAAGRSLQQVQERKNVLLPDPEGPNYYRFFLPGMNMINLPLLTPDYLPKAFYADL